MATQRTLVRGEDLLRPPLSDKRIELVNGVVVEMAAPGFDHASVAGKFTTRLGMYALGHGGRELGGISVRLSRDPDTVRIPDAAYITGPNPSAPGPGFLERAPDVVVEVVSPGDSATEVQAKAAMWLDAGVKLVWVAYPETSSIAVWRSGAEARLLRGDDVLEGGEALPGFSVPVREFFA